MPNFLDEYHRLEYQKQLKTIVEETNKLIKTDYNLISFDSLPPNNLLRVLNNILSHFGVFQCKAPVLPQNQLHLQVIKALDTIKYEPTDMDPGKFREDISTGNRKVIYPILHWILTNKELITKRTYLSKFMKKIEVPSKMISDGHFQSLFNEYEGLIEEFSKVYKEHCNQKIISENAEEVIKDVSLIRKDNSNLSSKIAEQEDKISSIPIKETFIKLAKTYQIQLAQSKKLHRQIEDAKSLMSNLESNRKTLRQDVEMKKMARAMQITPMEQVIKELHLNKLIYMSSLPKEILLIKNNMDLCEVVANNNVPTDSEIETFQKKIDRITKEINKIGIYKSCHNDESNLKLFQKQASILTEKKNALTDEVNGLKQCVSNLDSSLLESSQKQYDAVGGEIFYGDKLRSYISGLRELTVTYKKKKSLLNNASLELGVVSRTFDLLMLNDPTLKEQIATRTKLIQNCDIGDEDELRQKCRVLVKEIDLLKSSQFQKKSEISNLEKQISILSLTYEEEKVGYEAVVGDVKQEVDYLKREIESVEREIRSKVEMKQSISKSIKSKEELFVKLSEEYINTIGEGVSEVPGMIGQLKKRLKFLQDQKVGFLIREEKQRVLNLENAEQADIYERIVNVLSVVKV